MQAPAKSDPTPDRLTEALAGLGLILRGGFHSGPEEGMGGASLLLIGNAGPAMWRVFAAAPEARDGAADALDRWTARVLTGLAADFGAEAVFPFGGPPYRPFQRWAMRAEGLKASPLGILIHPRFGLWHAYRAAFIFREKLDLPVPEALSFPCDDCAEKPCLSTCPVSAFGPAGYDVEACVRHIASPAGRDCREEACRARRACPVGPEYHYDPAQAAFHMGAFLASKTGGRT